MFLQLTFRNVLNVSSINSHVFTIYISDCCSSSVSERRGLNHKYSTTVIFQNYTEANVIVFIPPQISVIKSYVSECKDVVLRYYFGQSEDHQYEKYSSIYFILSVIITTNILHFHGSKK